MIPANLPESVVSMRSSDRSISGDLCVYKRYGAMSLGRVRPLYYKEIPYICIEILRKLDQKECQIGVDGFARVLSYEPLPVYDSTPRNPKVTCTIRTGLPMGRQSGRVLLRHHN